MLDHCANRDILSLILKNINDVKTEIALKQTCKYLYAIVNPTLRGNDILDSKSKITPKLISAYYSSFAVKRKPGKDSYYELWACQECSCGKKERLEMLDNVDRYCGLVVIASSKSEALYLAYARNRFRERLELYSELWEDEKKDYFEQEEGGPFTYEPYTAKKFCEYISDTSCCGGNPNPVKIKPEEMYRIVTTEKGMYFRGCPDVPLQKDD